MVSQQAKESLCCFDQFAGVEGEMSLAEDVGVKVMPLGFVATADNDLFGLDASSAVKAKGDLKEVSDEGELDIGKFVITHVRMYVVFVQLREHLRQRTYGYKCSLSSVRARKEDAKWQSFDLHEQCQENKVSFEDILHSAFDLQVCREVCVLPC